MSRLRQVLPLEREYELRDCLARRAERPGQPVAVHVAGWKTASQWVRMLLSDPGLMRAAGYRPTYVRGRSGDGGLLPGMMQPSRLLTPVYTTADNPLLTSSADVDLRIAVVVREPVDLARSWYRTNAFGHPDNPDVQRRRALMSEAGSDVIDQFQALIAEDDFAQVMNIGSTWVARSAADPCVHIVDFADLIRVERQAQVIDGMLTHLGLPAGGERVQGLLARYHRTRLARVEALLRPPAERKYGAASHDDVVSVLTDDVVQDLLAEQLGQLALPPAGDAREVVS